jgi:hypothetical protein
MAIKGRKFKTYAKKLKMEAGEKASRTKHGEGFTVDMVHHKVLCGNLSEFTLLKKLYIEYAKGKRDVS